MKSRNNKGREPKKCERCEHTLADHSLSSSTRMVGKSSCTVPDCLCEKFEIGKANLNPQRG